MESQPQNPEFRNDPENFHPCGKQMLCSILILSECQAYMGQQVCSANNALSNRALVKSGHTSTAGGPLLVVCCLATIALVVNTFIGIFG